MRSKLLFQPFNIKPLRSRMASQKLNRPNHFCTPIRHYHWCRGGRERGQHSHHHQNLGQTEPTCYHETWEEIEEEQHHGTKGTSRNPGRKGTYCCSRCTITTTTITKWVHACRGVSRSITGTLPVDPTLKEEPRDWGIEESP